MTMEQNGVILKFDYAGEQTVENITKIVGLVCARYLVPVIDKLNLEANPRSSKTGDVTEAIQDTIKNNPALFPFMSKGILLGASQYERLERNRIRIAVVDSQVEGILDGGHNTLAIGLYILDQALNYAGGQMPRGSKTWDQFKTLWVDNRDKIDTYIKDIQAAEDNSELSFLIPVELLVPRDPQDENCVASFRNDLYSICEARNHNHELDLSTKENQRGYFEALKEVLERHNPQIAERVRWKTNTEGDVKAIDLVAISWIALSLVEPVRDERNMSKKVEPVGPTQIFSAKAACMSQFDKLMGSPDVTIESDDNYRRVLMNDEVKSAFEVAVQLPELYDYIYEQFPRLYNRSGGSYGGITAVKNVNKKTKKVTPFSGKEIDMLSPEGFLIPLLYGLQTLMEATTDSNGQRIIRWKQAPMPYLVNNLERIVKEYRELIVAFDWDPQKVGKSKISYTTALRLFKD